MRDHPIPPATEPFQYRAIGMVRGVYLPVDNEKFTRGKLITSDSQEIDAVVLGRVITLMKRHLPIDRSHLWVVYPRCRQEDSLHLQITGIWEPSTLSENISEEDLTENSEENLLDELPEGDDYFSIRGELIFTKPENNELVIKVRQKTRSNGHRPLPFKLSLEGQIPLAGLRNFVDLQVRRIGQKLVVEDYKLMGNIQTRTGKNRNNRNAYSGRSGEN
tara:strand:- start:4207 stop:4860 length:654 start_codon:yes stop_codon:yes gene_type:complete